MSRHFNWFKYYQGCIVNANSIQEARESMVQAQNSSALKYKQKEALIKLFEETYNEKYDL